MKFKILACAIAALCGTSKVFSQNTAGIQGLVLTQDNKPIKGGVVTATQVGVKASATAAHGTSQGSGSDGSFSIANLAAGTYNVCVNMPSSQFLDPCHWSAPVSVTLTSGQVLKGLQVKVKQGTTVTVHLNDPSQLLSANEGKKAGAHMLVGVWTPDGLFHAASVSSKGNAAREYSVTVPYDTALQLSLFSGFFQMADSNGKAVNQTGALVPLQFSSLSPATKPPVVQFTVTGTNGSK